VRGTTLGEFLDYLAQKGVSPNIDSDCSRLDMIFSTKAFSFSRPHGLKRNGEPPKRELHYDQLRTYIVEKDFGKRLSKEEVERIAQAFLGLAHMDANSLARQCLLIFRRLNKFKQHFAGSIGVNQDMPGRFESGCRKPFALNSNFRKRRAAGKISGQFHFEHTR
jgi:hypothetical protein